MQTLRTNNNGQNQRRRRSLNAAALDLPLPGRHARQVAEITLPSRAQASVRLNPSEEADPERNPNWRQTDAGLRARLTPPWMMASLVFGAPLVALVLLGWLLR